MKKRPSMNVVRRLAEVNPEKLIGDLKELQRAVEDMRIALGAKISTYVRKIGLEENDVLVIRMPDGISMRPEDLLEAANHAAKLLENRYGRPIPVIAEIGSTIDKRQGGESAES